jgi:hypothetical protein
MTISKTACVGEWEREALRAPHRPNDRYGEHVNKAANAQITGPESKNNTADIHG